MSKTKTICFTNNKGGSGKSTACANLAYELAQAGKKVLLIDGDMQLNLSLSFFDEEKVLDMAECEDNLYYAIRGKKDLKDYIVSTPYENLDLVSIMNCMLSSPSAVSRLSLICGSANVMVFILSLSHFSHPLSEYSLSLQKIPAWRVQTKSYPTGRGRSSHRNIA